MYDTNPQNRQSTSKLTGWTLRVCLSLYESVHRLSNIWDIYFINSQKCHNIVCISNRSVSRANEYATLRPDVTKTSFDYRTWIRIWLQLFSDLCITAMLKTLVCSGPVLKQQEPFKWRVVHMQICAIVWNLASTTNDRNASSACWT